MRPGCRQGAAVERVHGVDVSSRRREEELLDGSERLHGHGLLGGVDDLEEELAGDARQAARVERWRDEPAVEHDEDVRAGALAQLVAGVGQQGLAAPALVGPGEGDDVLGVARRLQPGHGRALVAHPGADGDRGRRLPRCRRADEHGEGGHDVASARPQRRPAGRDRDAHATDARSDGAEHGVARLPDAVVVGGGEPEPVAGPSQAPQVAAERERHAVDDLEGLEAAVTGRDAVVVDREAGIAGVDEAAVEPGLHVGVTPARRRWRPARGAGP